MKENWHISKVTYISKEIRLKKIMEKWNKVFNYETEDDKTRREFREGKITEREAFERLL